MITRPLKNEALIFGAALAKNFGAVFFHYLVQLMPVGIIHSKIDQYLDLPHRLQSFRAFYILGPPPAFFETIITSRPKVLKCENNNKWVIIDAK